MKSFPELTGSCNPENGDWSAGLPDDWNEDPTPIVMPPADKIGIVSSVAIAILAAIIFSSGHIASLIEGFK